MKFIFSFVVFFLLWSMACVVVNYYDDLHKAYIMGVGGVVSLIWAGMNEYINND